MALIARGLPLSFLLPLRLLPGYLQTAVSLMAEGQGTKSRSPRSLCGLQQEVNMVAADNFTFKLVLSPLRADKKISTLIIPIHLA